MAIKLSLLQKRQIKKLAEKNGLIFAVVYGSAAKGRQQPNSDFDLAVLTKTEPTTKLFGRLFSGFSDVFRGENVDLRFLNGADPFFRFEVVQDGQLVYGSKEEYDDYFAYAYKSYVDEAIPLLVLQRELLYKKQAELERLVL